MSEWIWRNKAMTISFGSAFEIRNAKMLSVEKFSVAMNTGYALSEIGIPVEQSDNIGSDEDLIDGKDITITYETPDEYDDVLKSFLANRGIDVRKVEKSL